MTSSIFQFWDSPEPPAEVSKIMATWKADPDFEYKKFTQEEAGIYIQKNIGDRAVAAYNSCAIPAMKADFFRYCVLYQEAGVYVDADTENGGGLAGLIAQAERGMVMNRLDRIANDFLYFRHAHDPLMKRVIDQAILNIESRQSNNVWKVTGPGVLTKLYNDEENNDLFAGMTITNVRVVREIVLFRNKMEYKSGNEDWRHHRLLDDSAQTIYTKI